MLTVKCFRSHVSLHHKGTTKDFPPSPPSPTLSSPPCHYSISADYVTKMFDLQLILRRHEDSWKSTHSSSFKSELHNSSSFAVHGSRGIPATHVPAPWLFGLTSQIDRRRNETLQSLVQSQEKVRAALSCFHTDLEIKQVVPF